MKLMVCFASRMASSSAGKISSPLFSSRAVPPRMSGAFTAPLTAIMNASLPTGGRATSAMRSGRCSPQNRVMMALTMAATPDGRQRQQPGDVPREEFRHPQRRGVWVGFRGLCARNANARPEGSGRAKGEGVKG